MGSRYSRSANRPTGEGFAQPHEGEFLQITDQDDGSARVCLDLLLDWEVVLALLAVLSNDTHGVADGFEKRRGGRIGKAHGPRQ